DDVVEEEVVDVLVVELLVVLVELLLLEVLVELLLLEVLVELLVLEVLVELLVLDVLVVKAVLLVVELLLVLEVLVELVVLVVLVVAVVLLVVELLDVLVELLVELLVDDDEVEVEVVLVVATVLLVVVELLDVLVEVVGTVVVVEHPGMGACWQLPVGSHVSVVQASPSSQLTALPPHWPAVHTSAVVQALASLHGVPSVTAVCAQPVAGSQLSVVQALPSSQLTALPTHWSARQTSPVVQALWSLQAVPSGTIVWTQIPA